MGHDESQPRDQVAASLDALRSAFSDKGEVADNLAAILAAEDQYASAVDARFGGYRLMHECFVSLLGESLVRAAEHARLDTSVDLSFRPLLVFVAGTFSRARSAESLFLRGYPWDAYALLRDQAARAVLIAAIMNGFATLYDILGIGNVDALAGADYLAMHRSMSKTRKKVHARIFAQMAGPKSGLPDGVQKTLRDRNEIFHSEVHLSVQSYFIEGSRQYIETGSLPLGPQPHEHSIGMYINRSLEVMWCLHRTMPIVQTCPNAFSENWNRRWSALDCCLAYGVRALAAQGYAFSGAVAELVDAKFAFDPSWSYERVVTSRVSMDTVLVRQDSATV